MEIQLITTIGGKRRIVDADDEAPLISFHNDFNRGIVAEMIFKFLTTKGKIDCNIKKSSE